MPDSQRENQSAEHGSARAVNGSDQVLGRLLTHAVVLRKLIGGQPEHLGKRMDATAIDKLLDQLVAKPFHIERLAACGMQQALLALRGAEQPAGAPRDRRVFQALDR